MGLYYYDAEENYAGTPVLYPVKTADNEYTFSADELEKYFEDGDYAAFVIGESMPEDIAVAYIYCEIAEGEYIVLWSDEALSYVSISASCDIIITVCLSSELEEVRQGAYDNL